MVEGNSALPCLLAAAADPDVNGCVSVNINENVHLKVTAVTLGPKPVCYQDLNVSYLVHMSLELSNHLRYQHISSSRVHGC